MHVCARICRACSHMLSCEFIIVEDDICMFKVLMAQKALKIQIDSPLDSENQKFRDFSLMRSRFVNLESELSLAKDM